MSSQKSERISFSSRKDQLEYPDFLEVQLKSFGEFFQLGTTPENRKKEGLYKVFTENFPITDTRNNFVLEFLDYSIDPPRYTIDECIERGLTFSVPLKAKLKLYCTDPEHEDFDTVIQDVYLGTVPYMTERGTFVINGAERVVVSQLHRSPGVFFGQSIHANGTKLYSARIIPFKGSPKGSEEELDTLRFRQARPSAGGRVGDVLSRNGFGLFLGFGMQVLCHTSMIQSRFYIVKGEIYITIV